MSSPACIQPKISVIVLNYNGQQWLPRCFESLEAQTIFADIEVIISDNNSMDGSDRLAAEWVAGVGRGRLVQNGANLYYCEGNNKGAAVATGKYLLFLNSDTWLEPTCLEKLYDGTEAARADASSPLVLNYDDETVQNLGGAGYDIFGTGHSLMFCDKPVEIFTAPGCSLLVSTAMFREIGGFDSRFLMYADESDLCWRVWIAGGRIVTVPAARLHHRGAAAVNPEGKTRMVEFRTSETKRYLTNRNALVSMFKNVNNVLFAVVFLHLIWLLLEACASLLLVRRWSYVRKSYLQAVADALRMWPHIRDQRRIIRSYRQQGDFFMLRFLLLRIPHWDDFKMILRLGLPKVDRK
jgi:GT2 family glycosyltransferase